MTSISTRVIAISSLLCILLAPCVSSLKESSRSHHYPSQQLYYNYESFENTTLAFAVCNTTEDQTMKNCRFVLERTNCSGDPLLYKCDVDLKINRKNTMIEKDVKVVPFGKNRAIALWGQVSKKDLAKESTLFRIAIIGFPDCKFTETKVYGLDHQTDKLITLTELMTYANTFDVIFSNEKICKDKLCRETFDAKGNRVSSPKAWFKSEKHAPTYFSPIQPDSKVYGHAVFEQDSSEDRISAYLVKNSDSKLLKRSAFFGFWAYGYSTSYATIGLCAIQSNKTIHCSQYNATTGGIKLERSLDLPQQPHRVFMYNTGGTNGGFLLFTISYSDCQREDYCMRGSRTYRLLRIDAKGETVGAMQLAGFQISNHTIPYAKFFENKDNEYCLSYTGIYAYDAPVNKNSGHVDLFVKCFGEKELLDT